MHPPSISASLVLIMTNPHLTLGNLGIDQRRLLLSRLLVHLGLPNLRAATIRGGILGAGGLGRYGQFDPIGGFLGRHGRLVILPRLDGGVGARCIAHVVRKRNLLNQNVPIEKAGHLVLTAAGTDCRVVHGPQVDKGILHPAKGGGISALVGMDAAEEGKVGRLEEAELAVDVRTGGEGGAGGSGELLACLCF